MREEIRRWLPCRGSAVPGGFALLCTADPWQANQHGSHAGVTGRPELPRTLALVVSPPGSERCGEAGAMPQTAAVRGSSPRANYRVPTHESNLDFRASCDTHCLGSPGSCSVPLLLEIQTVAWGDTSSDGPMVTPPGARKKRCRLPRCCHVWCSPHLALPWAKLYFQLCVCHRDVRVGELRGRDVEFLRGRQRLWVAQTCQPRCTPAMPQPTLALRHPFVKLFPTWELLLRQRQPG